MSTRKPLNDLAPIAVPHNGPLSRMIEQSQNPYHQIHVAKANELKNPKLLKFGKQSPAPSGSNPWADLMAKGK